MRFGTKFPVWQAGFASRLIKDQSDYLAHIGYIEKNPVKRGLVVHPEEHAFSSASGKRELDPWLGISGANSSREGA